MKMETEREGFRWGALDETREKLKNEKWKGEK